MCYYITYTCYYHKADIISVLMYNFLVDIS